MVSDRQGLIVGRNGAVLGESWSALTSCTTRCPAARPGRRAAGLLCARSGEEVVTRRGPARSSCLEVNVARARQAERGSGLPLGASQATGVRRVPRTTGKHRPGGWSTRFPRRGRRCSMTLWVPVIRSPHATCAYSWISPPRRSRRVILPGGGMTGGSADPSGGACPKVRCGRWPLSWSTYSASTDRSCRQPTISIRSSSWPGRHRSAAAA
jgi:hypothetical protein